MVDNLLSEAYRIFQILLASGEMLWEWFNSTISADVAEILSLPSDTTYLHLVLFSGIVMALLACLIRLFRGIIG